MLNPQSDLLMFSGSIGPSLEDCLADPPTVPLSATLGTLRNCESFISAFASNSDNALKTFLLRAIIGKLTSRAQILIGSRTELKSWDEIKQALNLSFGDQRDIDCLVQDLINLKPFKNKTPYNFGMRYKDSRSLIISKLNTLHLDLSEKQLHLRNYDNLALKTFVRGLPLPIQTNIRLRSPNSLEKAMSLVVEEENFLYSTLRLSFKPETMDISSGNTVLKSHSRLKFTSAELFNQAVDNSDSHDEFYSENPNYYENIDNADINNYYTQETEHS
ncbi:uncharacterized protein LOC130441660 [Diorhabda sublineata]|uniref:uncharacterized protein LOC130441660 n=1 Tax=Diorhabda sublineata TaxID=1163346 RepID=UPI0024E0C4BE|nr:uncharacterized protein LOC130441660 [Diorhabda sublineata]